MNDDQKGNIAVILAILIPIAVVVFCWWLYANNQLDTAVFIVVAAAAIIVCIIAVIAFFVGIHAFFTKKDKVDVFSSSTLDDIKEVDREMEKKKE